MSDNGGPAFPFLPTQDRHMNTSGMTLRDWFAGQAMLMCPTNSWEVSEAAKYCYNLADAMLKERSNHE
jgi:hypothetical protein